MRKIASIFAIVFLFGIVPIAQANGVRTSARNVPPPRQISVVRVSEIKVGLWQAERPDTRRQVTDCANVAVIRALMAKASGLDAALQSRVLNFTFLLCMQSA